MNTLHAVFRLKVNDDDGHSLNLGIKFKIELWKTIFCAIEISIHCKKSKLIEEAIETMYIDYVKYFKYNFIELHLHIYALCSTPWNAFYQVQHLICEILWMNAIPFNKTIWIENRNTNRNVVSIDSRAHEPASSQTRIGSVCLCPGPWACVHSIRSDSWKIWIPT